jgi:hypothetical protein
MAHLRQDRGYHLDLVSHYVGRRRLRETRSWDPFLAVFTLAGVMATAANLWPAHRGSQAEISAVHAQEYGNELAKRAIEDQERINRANLDRERKRYSSKVAIEITKPSSLGPQFIDRATEITVYNRSVKGILSLELLAHYDAAIGGDGFFDGAASLSTSASVPACTAVTFTLPADFDLADYSDGELAGQLLYAAQMTLLFFQDDVHWQLTPATGALAGDGDTNYSVALSRSKTDAGQLVRLGSAPLEDCVPGD